MNITIIIIVMLMLPMLQWKELRSGRWQDISVYAGLWVLAGSCAVLAGMGILLLRPFEWIKALLAPVTGLLG